MSGYGEPSIKFALQVGPQDVGLYAPVDPRIPQSHTAIGDYQKDCQDITAQTVTATRWTFKTDKNCDHFERMWLRFRINPVTATGGTYKRLINGFGLHLFDRIEMRCGTQLVQTIYPSDDTFLRYITEMKWENTFKLYPQVGLGLTKAERNSRATGIQEFIVPVELFWRDDITKDPIVPAIANGLIFDCYLRNPGDVIETDGTAGAFTLAEAPYLRQELVILDQASREEKVAMVTGGNQVTYFYDERITIPPITVLAGTTTTQEYRLEGLNGPMKQIYCLVRPATSVPTTGVYANDYTDLSWNYNPNTVRIRANQNDIVRPFSLRPFQQPSVLSRYHTGMPTAAILLNFSENPEAVNMASGHLNLSQATNPTISFVWTTATPVDYRIDIIGYSYNWIQHSGGQFRRIFTP